jgi:MoaA/NifB/PqqE/SkfB family radical SAM enzyme
MSCSPNFFESALDQAIPLSMQWDLTWRCDHKCVHCYLTDRHQDELTLDECKDILDQLAKAGTMMLLLSGGDLFLRPDALQIIREARMRSFDVKINTHGNHIDQALAIELAQLKLSQVSLSVYSSLA